MTNKKGIEIHCVHCPYIWIYKGKLKNPTCPSCHRNTPKTLLIFSKKEFEILCSTPKQECSICEELINHTIKLSETKYCIPKQWIEKRGFREHLEQIIEVKQK